MMFDVVPLQVCSNYQFKMARGTNALLTFFLVATILVLTTASQRRNGAMKRDLKTFTAKRVLSVKSRKLAQAPAAGDYSTNSYYYEADYFPCDYEGDYSCLEVKEDFPCDYEGDYSCLEIDEEEITPESNTSEDTPSAPSEKPTPAGDKDEASTTPTPIPSGKSPADNSEKERDSPTSPVPSAPGTGNAKPVTPTAPSTVPGKPIPEVISSLVNETSIPTEVTDTLETLVGESSSFTAWSAHYTACAAGFTVALAFFTNFFL